MSAVSTPVRLSRLTRSSERSLERVLQVRRSVREYSRKPLTQDELAQLLWAAQGVTGPEGLRTAPSAGALYPLEVDVVIGDVDGLPSAIYRYKPDRHELVLTREGDRRRELSAAALGQDCVEAGAAVIALSGVYERTTAKYGERGIRYVHMEVGHAAQNVCLQAAALGLGAVVVGAFEDGRVKRVLGLARDEEPLSLLPVGRPS
ncbi:MAG TPA: SagB/ThcOx family dehydrogenase [Candidatus Deferrimicrobiaceae bacterium]|nr:SagB/ThcOx family dehydrogenase [Candidatus Deferrimicrobiaceae bacterium]